MLTRNGSVPAFVMRTGMIQPMSPAVARRDLVTQHVLDVTMDRQQIPQAVLPAQPSPTTNAVAQTVTAVPPQPIQTPAITVPDTHHAARHGWHVRTRRQHPAIDDIRRLHPKAPLHGAVPVELGEWAGRPIAKFEIHASPDRERADLAAQSLLLAARALRHAGLSQLPAELIGGPVAALMRGGAVELHFQNAVVIRTAL